MTTMFFTYICVFQIIEIEEDGKMTILVQVSAFILRFFPKVHACLEKEELECERLVPTLV